jgi:hypothetical protein
MRNLRKREKNSFDLFYANMMEMVDFGSSIYTYINVKCKNIN